jgi:lipopolysaccharide/colanic/teichoic acid biosynthesis glycosyltransferase
MKRAIDTIIAIFLMVVFLPVFLLAAFLVFLFMGYPILFKQVRAGLSGKPFQIYKFRTMSNKQDSSGRKLPDEQRMTKLGTILRKLSLDELPQLLNVLKGDMSLVGPRPLLMEYLPLYTSEQGKRNTVKPGITGWAQVNGRNNISWEEKFKLDVWYVDNQSLLLDFKIILLTIKTIISRKGVNMHGNVTATRFMGSKS